MFCLIERWLDFMLHVLAFLSLYFCHIQCTECMTVNLCYVYLTKSTKCVYYTCYMCVIDIYAIDNIHASLFMILLIEKLLGIQFAMYISTFWSNIMYSNQDYKQKNCLNQKTQYASYKSNIYVIYIFRSVLQKNTTYQCNLDICCTNQLINNG